MPPETPPDFVATVPAVDRGKASLQDLFLAAAAREHERMTLFLINGVMLQGSVTGFDQFSLVLERGGQVQLVYKHAISTLQPAHPLNLGAEQGGEGEGES
jgi:host factor-I protein